MGQRLPIILCVVFLTTIVLFSTVNIFFMVTNSSSSWSTISNSALRVPCNDCDTKCLHGNLSQLSSSTERITAINATGPAKRGFILAFRFWEQQTKGLRSFVQLQCLAHSYGMRVVEPFFVRSLPSFPFDELLKGTKLLRLRELINVDAWNVDVATRYGYAPMASWDEFLQEAPRKLILVCVRYRNPPHISVPIPGVDYRRGCPEQCFERFVPSLSYLKKYGFFLLEKQCANFVHFGTTIPARYFKETLMGNHEFEDLTILLTEFRGFYGFYRLPVVTDCGVVHYDTNVEILPSSLVSADTEKYIAIHFQSQPYIAILGRVELLILHLRYNVSTCARDLIRVLEEIHTSRGISRRFLGLDVGRFGSQGSDRSNLTAYGKQIFHAVYGNQWSFEEWESSFDHVAHNSSSAYVANVQRLIAAKSQCLVMCGKGSFQKQAQDFYQLFHPNLQSQCLYTICHEEPT